MTVSVLASVSKPVETFTTFVLKKFRKIQSLKNIFIFSSLSLSKCYFQENQLYVKLFVTFSLC